MAFRKHRNTRRRKSAYRPLPSLHPVDPVYESLGLGLLFVATLTLFALSTGRTVLLEDDGLFITAAYTLGVVHPPGYPLYTLLGWLYTHIPFGSIAWRVHLLSGTFGALTCVCVAWLVLRRTGSRLSAWLAGAMLAVSEHFWSQSIIADVYTFNAALLFSTLVLGQEAVVRRSNRLWIAAAVCYGLGLANHWILLVLGSPILLAWGWAGRQQLISRLYFLVPIALATAGLLYGWLVYRSNSNPEINFLGPIKNLSDFIAYIRRDIYSSVDNQVTAGLIDKVYYAGNTLWQLFIQFTPLGFLIALLGVLHQYRQGWRLGLYAELAAVFGGSLALILALGFEYNAFKVGVFRPYLVAIYAVLALWFGYGLAVLYSRLKFRASPVAVTTAGSALIAGVFWLNVGVNWRADETFSRDYAKTLLDSVEPNSVLVTVGDLSVLSSAYLHIAEGYRPDVRLLEYHGLVFNDRVPTPRRGKKKRELAWVNFFLRDNRPFYHQNLTQSLSKYSGQFERAFVKKADKSLAKGTVGLVRDDVGKVFARRLLSLPDSRDRWMNRQRNSFLRSYGSYLGYILASQAPQLIESVADILPEAEENYWTLVGMSFSLIKQAGPHAWKLAEKYVGAASQIETDRSKPQIANLIYLQASVAHRSGDLEKALELLSESIQINPDKENPAHDAFENLTKLAENGSEKT